MPDIAASDRAFNFGVIEADGTPELWSVIDGEPGLLRQARPPRRHPTSSLRAVQWTSPATCRSRTQTPTTWSGDRRRPTTATTSSPPPASASPPARRRRSGCRTSPASTAPKGAHTYTPAETRPSAPVHVRLSHRDLLQLRERRLVVRRRARAVRRRRRRRRVPCRRTVIRCSSTSRRGAVSDPGDCAPGAWTPQQPARPRGRRGRIPATTRARTSSIRRCIRCSGTSVTPTGTTRPRSR